MMIMIIIIAVGHQGNPHFRESRILAPVRPRMQAAALRRLKLQSALASPDPQTRAFPGTKLSRRTRSPKRPWPRRPCGCSRAWQTCPSATPGWTAARWRARWRPSCPSGRCPPGCPPPWRPSCGGAAPGAAGSATRAPASTRSCAATSPRRASRGPARGPRCGRRAAATAPYSC